MNMFISLLMSAPLRHWQIQWHDAGCWSVVAFPEDRKILTVAVANNPFNAPDEFPKDISGRARVLVGAAQ